MGGRSFFTAELLVVTLIVASLCAKSYGASKDSHHAAKKASIISQATSAIPDVDASRSSSAVDGAVDISRVSETTHDGEQQGLRAALAKTEVQQASTQDSGSDPQQSAEYDVLPLSGPMRSMKVAPPLPSSSAKQGSLPASIKRTSISGHLHMASPDCDPGNANDHAATSKVLFSGPEDEEAPTGVEHLVFAIASSKDTWQQRAAFLRTWWDPSQCRGHVWLDAFPVDQRVYGDPEHRISGDTGHLKMGNDGLRRYVRMARIVVEAFRLQLPNVRWFVKGDDDTFFSPHGVAALLSRYDHRQMMFVGGQSETHLQNHLMSHEMAFGGGGFAISWALAAALNRTMDECLDRHTDLWGSDKRVAACIAELGVHVTRERGFHQCDVRGSLAGMLEAHSPEVFASLHHVPELQPVFPTMKDPVEALQLLADAIRPDPVGFAQQAACYIQGEQNWTASIAWGYSVKLYPKMVRLGGLQRVERTFATFYGDQIPHNYDLDMRKVRRMGGSNDTTCQLPFVMYVTEVRAGPHGTVESMYERANAPSTSHQSCPSALGRLNHLRVIRHRPMEVPMSSTGLTVGPNLRRQCCKKVVLTETERGTEGTIWLEDCDVWQVSGVRQITTN